MASVRDSGKTVKPGLRRRYLDHNSAVVLNCLRHALKRRFSEPPTSPHAFREAFSVSQSSHFLASGESRGFLRKQASQSYLMLNSSRGDCLEAFSCPLSERTVATKREPLDLDLGRVQQFGGRDSVSPSKVEKGSRGRATATGLVFAESGAGDLESGVLQTARSFLKGKARGEPELADSIVGHERTFLLDGQLTILLSDCCFVNLGIHPWEPRPALP